MGNICRRCYHTVSIILGDRAVRLTPACAPPCRARSTPTTEAAFGWFSHAFGPSPQRGGGISARRIRWMHNSRLIIGAGR